MGQIVLSAVDTTSLCIGVELNELSDFTTGQTPSQSFEHTIFLLYVRTVRYLSQR